jgi:glutaredoxin
MVYGAAWCEHTTRVRRQLDDWGIPHHYIDVEKEPFAIQKLTRWGFGIARIPAVSVGVREDPRLIGPSDKDLYMMIFGLSIDRVIPLLI